MECPDKARKEWNFSVSEKGMKQLNGRKSTAEVFLC
jgi:hypothetical protein